ncbi:DUF885 domain-containing protein [Sandaracinobacter neustonicus]|uniref:DUF885 domain-containing protein n=1 Tax=Sandaracinobacter neustonicus TaxID=1715348 RepID=A0A501XHR7_9SPHN|nr:DUF885 domain-containing protein [Sandaracinobacter neustonicus]TPE60086.1 DUF885 domain-containing protein [Sandaracinobacter neustonicus]
MLLRAALISSALALAVAGPAVTAAPAVAVNGEQNAALAAFFEAYDQKQLALSPEMKTFRSIRDADFGKWTDDSDAANLVRYKLGQDSLAEMKRRFDPAKLSGQSKLSYRLFEYQMARQAAAWPLRHYRYAFDQMNGVQSGIPAFLINIHQIGSKADAEAYISRLNGIGAVLDQAIANATDSEKIGVIPPRWTFPYVLADIGNITKGAPFDGGADSALFADFKGKVAKLDLPQAEKDALIAQAATALTQVVKPAYARTAAFITAQQARAPEGDGVWRFPGGDKYYAERLAFYTTSSMTPAQVHDLGLQQVARIHGEMDKIRQQVGFKGDLKAFFEYMRTRPENYFPNTAEGRAQYLAETDKAIKAMTAKLPAYFSPAATPKAPLTVKAVEPFREKSAGKAFYNRPAPDGSRPGIYYVNLYDMADMPNTEVEALAYHEGVPGHHLDGSVTSQLKDLPAFRRFGGFTAWSEGWGLYAEKLGKDMGFYTDPYRDFGRLQLELHRAIRLVVDTGLHDKKWSREQAIQYVLDNSADAPGGVVKAIERYAVLPGQATAYMVGRLKISELRDKAQKELGAKFNMADFHDAVLLSGAVPMDVLEENVNAYIAAKKAK